MAFGFPACRGYGGLARQGGGNSRAPPRGLEPVVRTGDGRQSRFPGGVEKNRLDGGEIIERVRLSPTDLVADRTQAHRTHASTVATGPVPGKRVVVPICAHRTTSVISM